jgi:hypothetical protein
MKSIKESYLEKTAGRRKTGCLLGDTKIKYLTHNNKLWSRIYFLSSFS